MATSMSKCLQITNVKLVEDIGKPSSMSDKNRTRLVRRGRNYGIDADNLLERLNYLYIAQLHIKNFKLPATQDQKEIPQASTSGA